MKETEAINIKQKYKFKKKLIHNGMSGESKKKMPTKTKKVKSSEIDFDPFEIYPNNMEHNKPILLVDLGFTTFYRFNATKTWYKHSHPEEKEQLKSPDYDWGNNQEFIDKFDKLYIEKILLMAKKFSVPKHNVILAQDCKSCDNWRGKLFKDYKLTRKLNKEKNGFDGESVFKHAYEYTFNAMAKNYGFKLIKHKDIEADDINAIIAQYYQKHFPKLNIFILATDKDYLQLGNGKTHLINFQGVILNDPKKDPTLNNGEYQLWYKILIGDKSDNIPAIKIKRKYVKPNAKTGLDTYINITNESGKLLASNMKEFMKNLDNDPEMINQTQFNLNRKLIDFNMIPQKYQKIIIKELETYLH